MTDTQIDQKMEAPEGFKEIIFPKQYGIGRSYVGGDTDKNRLRVKYFIRKSDKRFFAKVFFGVMAQGPPFHAHGGSQAAVLDETMGLAAWVADKSVVSASIKVEYVKMLKLLQVCTIETWIEKVDGRKVWVKSELKDENNIVYSRGTGLFIIIPDEKISKNGFHKELREQVDL
ncbi:MAG: PaaI family thioesterase [Bacteroidetes bacterium]|nr:MAG: PaaI family thioesterase [Bacteroidota bacterium]